MSNHEAVILLFTISKELKRALEKPVVLLTHKDYAEGIHNALLGMRSALLQRAEPQRVLDIVNAFHGEWLTAVNDVEHFKKRLRGIPRETIFRAIIFTRVSVLKRYKAFQKYITELKSTLTEYEDNLIQEDLLNIAGMQQSVLAVLTEKEDTLRTTADAEDYYNKILDEVEELMIWLDSLNDSLAVEFSKVIGLQVPRLNIDLSKTLRQVIEELGNRNCGALITQMQSKGQKISSSLRYSIDELEIKDIIKKINILQRRISKLKEEKSSAVTALEHKTHYLEERLRSLEDLKQFTLKNQQDVDTKLEDQGTLSNKSCHIFNHLLPAPERGHLVEELMSLWTDAIYGLRESTQSIISILSVTDIKQAYVDDLGEFAIDKYGRKIYTVDTDDRFYQRNENNELVPLNDNDKHIYFFDECGRYYINQQEDRIYAEHEDASEYFINSQHLLQKVSEMREGIKYLYDTVGKYYLDRNNKRIYYDDKTAKKYENDGFGNLVVIRNDLENAFISAPSFTEGIMQLQDNLYLQEVVSEALKKCIVDVVIHQPENPVMYLAECLEAYRHCQKAQQHRIDHMEEMMALREERRRELSDTPRALDYEYGSEEGTVVFDENFFNYKHK